MEITFLVFLIEFINGALKRFLVLIIMFTVLSMTMCSAHPKLAEYN